jgi:hypothetical protein
LLDSTGNPVCTGAIASGSAAATTGYEFDGAKAFELTLPEPRKITHTGEDRVLQVDFLPALDGVSGSLNVAENDYALNAMLQGVSVATVGEAKGLAYATDKQGSEPDVSLLLYQQAQDSATGLRRWRVELVARAKAIPIPPGMNDMPAEVKYSLTANPCTKTIWGETITSGSYGCTQASVMEFMCEGEPVLEAFQGDVTTPTVLTLSATPKAAAKLAVYRNGVKLATPGGYSLATNKVTLVAGLGATDYAWVWYEK